MSSCLKKVRRKSSSKNKQEARTDTLVRRSLRNSDFSIRQSYVLESQKRLLNLEAIKFEALVNRLPKGTRILIVSALCKETHKVIQYFSNSLMRMGKFRRRTLRA